MPRSFLTPAAFLLPLTLTFGLCALTTGCNDTNASASEAAPETPAPVGSTSGKKAADDLSALSDEFDNAATLGNWKRVHREEGWNADQLEKFDIGKSRSGWMTMMPFTSTWYQDYRGVLAFKPVSGDFVMTTKVKTSGRNGSGPPRAQFSLAGIMIRAPRNLSPQTWRPGGENYVFLSLGSADRAGTYQFEVKTTVNSDSQLRTSPTNSGEAIIQVARIGSSLILLKNEGGRWSVHQRYNRPDFPKTLQAGLTVYTDWPNAHSLPPQQQNGTVVRGGSPDLLAQFDYVRYTRPQVPENLRGKALDNPAVSDSALLQFLGDNAL
ncbi:MAG: hypothetical protein OHK0029_27020 [Armatimonadaceae bacterium]